MVPNSIKAKQNQMCGAFPICPRPSFLYELAIFSVRGVRALDLILVDGMSIATSIRTHHHQLRYLAYLHSPCSMPFASKFDSLVLIAGSLLTLYVLSLPYSYLALIPIALCLFYASKRTV